MTPCRLESFGLNTVFKGFFTFEQIYRYMTQDAEIFRCMAFSDPAMVFSKRDIQTPMLAVFDAVVLAINGLEAICRPG